MECRTPGIAPFPFHRFEGTPRDVGLQHGRRLGDRIQVSIDLYASRFSSRSGLEWPEVLRRSETISDSLEATSPDLHAEIEGIAVGAEQPLAAIVALNARTMFLRAAGRALIDPEDDAECTTGALLPDATANGHTYLFGNWDQHERCIDNSVLLEIRVVGRPAVFVLTEAGILIRTGFNEHGIGITGNSLWSGDDTGSTSGVPWPVVRRRVLHHDRLATAMGEVFGARRTHSGNHVVADAEGFAVDLEASPSDVFALVPDAGLLTHSNHFLSVGARSRLTDVQLGRSPSTLYRNVRVEGALRPRVGSIGVADIQAALRDHFGHPQSVCAHARDTNTMTVASHIADLTERTMTISSGPPCENDYRVYRLDPTVSPRSM